MHRWKLSALATAAIVSASLTTTDAWALTLGRLQIQSALGEPLRAAVDLPQITPAEAASLNARIASPEVFRAQGMQYNTVAGQVKIVLQRRADGSAVLQLRSEQPVNESFVDLVIDASWSAGQVMRNYTLLLNPPAWGKPAPSVTAPPQTADSTTEAGTAAPPSGSRRRHGSATGKPAPATASPDAVTVRAGDTAGKIASAHRPAGVSLDQMLVAMLRANPHAFISGNVNRMRTGAVLAVPDKAAAQAIPAGEARQIVAAQSRDFNAYRRRLAGAAPKTAVATAQRSASGNVQTQVEDSKPSTAAPDKLTLSKGALQAQQADERLAREKQAQSQSERLAELSRNLSDLQQVASAAGAPPAVSPAPAPTVAATPAAAPATTTAAGAPAPAGVGLPVGSIVPAATPAETPATDTPPPPTTPAEVPPPSPAPATAEPPPKPVAPVAPTPVPPRADSTWFEQMAWPVAGGGLLALLLGYAGYRTLQRRRAQSQPDGHPLPVDSLFGPAGDQRLDSPLTSAPAPDFPPDPLGSAAAAQAFADPAALPDSAAPADVAAADLDFGQALRRSLADAPAPMPADAMPASTIDFAAAASNAEGTAQAATETAHPDEASTSTTAQPAAFFDAFDNRPDLPPAPVSTEHTLPDLAFTPDSPPEPAMAPATTSAPERAPDPARAPAPAPVPALDFLELKLDDLSLDLDAPAPTTTLSQSNQAAAEDPLTTKLALAQEFAAIGDSEGARALIEEVIEESDGELKAHAQRLLAEIK